jgi:hypothetical protein
MSSALRAFIVTPSFEPALLAELATGRQPARLLAPGVVMAGERSDVADAAGVAGVADGDDAAGGVDGDHDPIFARQMLPGALELLAPSVKQLAEAAYGAVESAIDAATGPFTLHGIIAPPRPAPAERQPLAAPRFARSAAAAPGGGLGSRVELVGRQLLDLLKERRRRAFRRFHPAPEAVATFDGGWLLVQLLALDRQRLLVSAAHPRPRALGGTDLSPWPAGAAPVAVDRAPPSRAYQKLEEAFLWMAAAPAAGQSCVDLGGAPGGWAYCALRRGARVTAVDRAPLLAPAAGHANLTAIIGNAFTYEPPRPVDWLLCDVVCEPARSIALVERWLERGWCRNLVVTVKFKGRDGYGILSALLPMLARAGWRFGRVKQLGHNKNEVTVMGRERC